MTPTDLSPTPTRGQSAERWGGLSGIAASVLIFVSGAFAPNPPSHDGTDAAMLAHFRTHYDGTMQGVYAWMLGAMALLLFAAVLVRAVERARRAAGREPGVLTTLTLLAATVAAGRLVAAQAGAAATAVVGRHATDAALPRAFDELGHMLAHLSVVPLGVFVLASALALRDARVGARWLAALGVPIGVFMTLSGTWVFIGGWPLHNAGGLGWLAMLLWWIAQGVSLVRAGRRAPVSALAPASGAVAMPVAAAPVG